jgi:aminodeoxychorismate synthase component I
MLRFERSSSDRTAVAVRELGSGFDLPATFELLRGQPFAWLLDSALPGPRLGRFSFAGADPYLVIRFQHGAVELECRRAARSDLVPGRTAIDCDPLELVRQLMPPPPEDSRHCGLPFLGGSVGYWGYELAERTEPVSLHGRDDLHLPDLMLLFVDRLIAVDHLEDRAYAIGLGFSSNADRARLRAERAAEGLVTRVALCPPQVRRPPPIPLPGLLATPIPADLCADFDESAYAKAVDSILREIEAGNVYQADLTHRMDLPFDGDTWQLYRILRETAPAPFASYLELPGLTILSSSPERFLRLDADGRVESRPIKGTRPRGASPEQDRLLEAELAASAKDRAENLMIVDLVRNDLGRVCEPGSIEVPELMVVERYASVFQMVSRVTGRLRSDCDATDLLRASFPPGSMTGAPKIAAMRLLDRLETVRRGVYSGAIGYLDLRGGADLSVVIRTLLVRAGRAYLNVGGGVVADSDPVAEYRETLDKARALLAALSRCAGSLRPAGPPLPPR